MRHAIFNGPWAGKSIGSTSAAVANTEHRWSLKAEHRIAKNNTYLQEIFNEQINTENSSYNTPQNLQHIHLIILSCLQKNIFRHFLIRNTNLNFRVKAHSYHSISGNTGAYFCLILKAAHSKQGSANYIETEHQRKSWLSFTDTVSF